MAGRRSPLGGYAAASIDGQTALRTIVTSFRNPKKCQRFGIRHAQAVARFQQRAEFGPKIFRMEFLRITGLAIWYWRRQVCGTIQKPTARSI